MRQFLDLDQVLTNKAIPKKVKDIVQEHISHSSAYVDEIIRYYENPVLPSDILGLKNPPKISFWLDQETCYEGNTKVPVHMVISSRTGVICET